MAIDSLENYPQSRPQLISYAALLVASAAIGGIFRFYMRRLLIGISRKIEYSIRADFFSHLEKLDSTFFENNRTGSIMALISNDLDAVRNFLGPGLLNLFNTILIFIATLTVMFLINIRLTLYALIAIPLLPLIVSKLSAMLHKRFRISQEHYALLSARTQEHIAGIKVIKSFTQENNEINNFAELNAVYVDKNMSLARVRSVFWPLMLLIGGIGSLVVLWIGGIQVINNVLTIGQFVQFSAYILVMAWPLISLGWVINIIQRGEVSMARINKVLKMKPLIKDYSGPFNAGEIKGHIVFSNVCFKYPSVKSYDLYDENPSRDDPDKNQDSGKDWILENINFEVQPGSRTGIVGFTGSGKSTIVNLILRLYDCQKGNILIDGNDIKKIPLSALRSKISYVTQDPFIFSKSIRQNIIFGNEKIFENLSSREASERIINVSSAAHLHEDIKDFPDGYETLVGERGVTLSGGQKQRLAIARALIKGPSILILDDSFSNIDTNTEELILMDLKKITAGLTTIIISHRISTVKDSDLILVVDEGKILNTGSHDSLLKESVIYRKLYQRQQLTEELDEEL